MSSYYPRFKYLGINSQDKNLIVANLDGGDSGEMDTFLGMDPIYTDNAFGTQRLDYGAKFNNVAVIRITTIRQDGGDFSVENTRDCLKWITGSRTTSPLDLISYTTEIFEEGNTRRTLTDDGKTECQIEDQVEDVFHVYIDKTELSEDQWAFDKDDRTVVVNVELSEGDNIIIDYSKIMFTFIGRVTSAWHYKMDARTIGITFEFTSISPWAYSPVKTITKTIDGETSISIPNESDDIDTPIYVKTTFTNTQENGSLILVNTLTQEETTLYGLVENETVVMDSNQIITSKDNRTRIFGNDFNFNFPCLRRYDRTVNAEDNVFSVSGTGDITFEYIVPIKAGDCVMDVMSMTAPICDESGNIQIDTLDWKRISGTPSSLSGYGITDAYTKDDIDKKFENLDISGTVDISWDKITNKPTKLEEFNLEEDYYTAPEIDNKFKDIDEKIQNSSSNIEIDLTDYYTKSEVDALLLIDEGGLKDMLDDVLR